MFRRLLARRRGEIYWYNNGVGRVYVDPVDLWHRLFDSEAFDLHGNMKDLFSDVDQIDAVEGAKIKDEAFFAVTDFATEALGIKRIDRRTGRGLSRDDVLLCLMTFIGWMDDIKKKRDALLAKLQDSDFQGESPDSSTSGSTSTSDESTSSGQSHFSKRSTAPSVDPQQPGLTQ